MLFTSPFNIHSRQMFSFKSALIPLLTICQKCTLKELHPSDFFERDSNLEFLSMYVDRKSGLCDCVLANFRPDNHAWCGDVVRLDCLRCKNSVSKGHLNAKFIWLGLGDFAESQGLSRGLSRGLSQGGVGPHSGYQNCRFQRLRVAAVTSFVV